MRTALLIAVLLLTAVLVFVTACYPTGNTPHRTTSTTTTGDGCSLYVSIPNPCDPESNN